MQNDFKNTLSEKGVGPHRVLGEEGTHQARPPFPGLVSHFPGQLNSFLGDQRQRWLDPPLPRERIFIELRTSDRKLEASREGWK